MTARVFTLALALLAGGASIGAQDRTVELLRLLADTAGAPGFEEPIRKVMVDQMRPFASAITFDGLGSIIATQGTTGPRIMVDAHMDELGGMVRRITPRGLLTMQMLGGWLDQALVDQRWTIIGAKGPVKAVTGIRDVHVVPADERTRVYPRDSLFLDVGATSEAEVRAMGISVGDPIVPDAPFEVLNGTGRYLGKAWDDRVGCAVVVEAMRRLATRAASEPDFLGDHDAGGDRPSRRALGVRRGEAGAGHRHRGRHHRRRVPGPPRRDPSGAGRRPGAVRLRFVGAAEPQAQRVREADGGGPQDSAADSIWCRATATTPPRSRRAPAACRR